MKRLCVLVAIGLFGQFNGPEAKAQTPQGQLQSEVVLRDGRITDAATGLQFRKVCGIAGTKDIVKFNYDSQHLRMSPNGKFFLYNNYVIPLEDGKIIKLVDLPALRSVWSPDGKKIVFYSDGIWVIPVSPETGSPTGPAQELLDGGYMYQFNVRWSPDSEKIVFWSTDQHLSILSLDDGKITKITQGAQYYVQGGWSPDGRWIVFNQNRNSMWMIPSEGGEARKLAGTAGRAMAHWSPDGKWVFYQRNRKLHFIRISDVLSFNITLPQEVGYYVSWSQDDKKMLFYKCSYEYMNTLKIVPSSGGEPFGPIGLNLSWDQRWSADSKFVLTRGKHDGKWTYWIVPLTGDEPFPLRLDVSMRGVLNQESLSPDARKLLFSQQTADTEKQYWVTPILPRRGKTVGLPTKIFDRGEVDGFVWIPDGSKLFFPYQENLWMARTDGSPPMQIPMQIAESSDHRVVGGACSRDGSAIVWLSHFPSSGKSILQIRRLSEDESRLITESPTYISFKWSPYGRHIAYEFFERKKDTNRELYIVPALGGESKRLIQGSIDRWAWSPSGDRLAVLADQKLLIFRIPDGEYYQLGKLLDPNWNECHDMKWSPDGREIALIILPKLDSSTQDITSLFTVSVPEGTWTKLTGRSGTSYSLSWSPNGKWIAYDLEDFIKTRPEGILWEVEVETYLKKMNEKLPRSSSSSKD